MGDVTISPIPPMLAPTVMPVCSSSEVRTLYIDSHFFTCCSVAQLGNFLDVTFMLASAQFCFSKASRLLASTCSLCQGSVFAAKR